MAFMEKFRRLGELIELGKTIFDILVAIGGGKLVQAGLVQFTRIPTAWITPIWLLSSAGILWLLLKLMRPRPVNQPQTASQIIASVAMTPAATSPVDVDAFFLHTYSGQLQVETERNVRAMIQSRPHNEREEFAVRFIATGLVSVIYDRIWLTIFRSQILALQALNQKILRREEVKAYYDTAALGSPTLYSAYPFTNWLSYLTTQLLIIEHPGDTVEITVRGKDFLKYMVHCGYTADGRQH